MSTNTTAATPTIVNNLAVPLNAVNFSGLMTAANSTAGTVSFTLFSSAASTAPVRAAVALSAGGSQDTPVNRLKLSTRQRMFYIGSTTAGTPTFSLTVSGYEI
jgi:hypothetical protein